MSTKIDGLFQVSSKLHSRDYRWEDGVLGKLLKVKCKVKDGEKGNEQVVLM